MKIALIFGPFCLAGGANGFDVPRLWSDKRGLSGSDLGFFRMGQELARLGHEVALFTFPKPGTTLPTEFCPGVRLHHYDQREAVVDDSYDAIVSWNESEPLRVFANRKRLLRAVSLQINTLCFGPDYDDYVDLWLSPSESHRRMILGPNNDRIHSTGNFFSPTPYKPNPANWEVVPDGCDPEVYDQLFERGVVKQPGRLIWSSSPDRGLHWLLSIWPRIKRECPDANLRIFYRLKPWLDHMLAQDPIETDPSIKEQISRARYIQESIERFERTGGLDIEFRDSVSRREIVREQCEATVFPYTCDPPAGVWTEGFSCSLAENCAARTVCVTTAVDALPELYGGVCPMIPKLDSSTVQDFADIVINALRTDVLPNGELVESVIEKQRRFAAKFTWANATRILSDVLQQRILSSNI